MKEVPSLISLNDLMVVPFVLMFFFLLIRWLAPFYIKDKALLQFFYFGLFLKAIGVTLSLLFYLYIETKGDTHAYFNYGTIIAKFIASNNFSDIYKLFCLDYADLPFPIKSQLPATTFFEATFSGNTLMIQLAAITSYLTFHSYLSMSIVFSLWGYFGIWLIFYKLVQMYPQLRNLFFIFIICWPSLIFFGSGVLKEPLCLGAIGILFFLSFSRVKSLAGFVITFLLAIMASALLFYIKPYLFLSFAVAYVIARIFAAIHSFKNRKHKQFSYLFILSFIVFSIFIIAVSWGSFVNSSAMKNLLIFIFKTTSAQLTLGNTGYDLGKIETTPIGIISYLTMALNVSLYRPFVFEITKPPLVISGFESLVMLILTVYTFYKLKFKSIFLLTLQSPFLIFSLIFVVLVGIQIGSISFNFGTLVRYKMPLLPFFFSSFLILLYKGKQKK